MSGSSNGSQPRSPRPVRAMRRHAALVVSTGSLLVGLVVLTGIALDGTRAAGQTPPHDGGTAERVELVDLGDPAGAPVVTDVLGERAAQLSAFFASVGASTRRPDAPARPAVIDPGDGSVWDRLARCEAGGDWATESAAGYSGGLGFAHSTWRSNGGEEFAPRASQATREQQIVVAERVLAGSGWGAWPGCSSVLGLR